MRFYVSGNKGWIGGKVVQGLQKRNHKVADNLDQAEAVIHLAWCGIPNYTNPIHFGNIEWQSNFLKQAAEKGITNITIAGTCLETLDKFIPYSIAKLAVKGLALDLFPKLKWVRLWYLYGEGQRETCLYSRLMKAKAGQEFSVIDGERDFMEVTTAAERIVDIALQKKVTGTIDCCSGVAIPLEDFCRRHRTDVVYKKDYQALPYEPFSFCGNPAKLLTII